MSVVLLVLLAATAASAVGLFAAMFVHDKPLWGAMALGLLLGPGTALTFLYVTLTN